MKLTGENLCIQGKTCPNSILSTTNPTWIDPESNQVLRGRRTAANCLSRDTALHTRLHESVLYFVVCASVNSSLSELF
jgi:hypothetical protein